MIQGHNMIYPEPSFQPPSSLHFKTVPLHNKVDNGSKQTIVSNSFNICKICQQEKMHDDMVILGDCQHFFCFDCVHSHVQERMRQNLDINCCQEGCMNLLILKKSRNTSKQKTYISRLTKQMKKQIKIYKENYQKAKEKCLNCEYNDKKQKILKCKTCQNQNFEIPDHLKRCTSCSKVIEKQKGCDHVKCVCGHEFCFVCSQTWDRNHICEHKIPKRSGLAYCACFILKLPLYLIVGTFLILILIALSLLICVLSACFFGMFAYIKVIDKMSKNQSILGSIKFLIFIFSIVTLPVLIAVSALPGFFLPLINLCYKEKIFLEPTTLTQIAISMFGCFSVLQLI